MHSFDSLIRTRRTTEAIASLPAVAHLDWFDRAAAALCHCAPGAACVLMLVAIDPSGRVTARHAVGAAGAAPIEPEVLESLRARARRITDVGFGPAALGPDHVTNLQSLDAGWREKQTGRLWTGLERPEVLCGLHGVEEPAVLLSLVALPAPSADAVSVLRAVLPALVERAARSLGAAIANSSAWLTTQEQRVLDQLTLGRSVREIAEIMGRSPHTIHDHVKSLHRKLGASTRGGLIARAMGHEGDVEQQIEPKASGRRSPSEGAPSH